MNATSILVFSRSPSEMTPGLPCHGGFADNAAPSPSETILPVRNTTVTSSPLSDSAQVFQLKKPQELPLLDDFAVLTLLLRLVVILKNQDGNASMHEFIEGSMAAQQEPHQAFMEPDFTPTNAIGVILGLRHEVVAANYRSPRHPLDRFVAVSASNLQGDDGHDEAHPNPQKIQQGVRSNLRGSGDRLHNLQLVNISGSTEYWEEIQKDPLYRMAT